MEKATFHEHLTELQEAFPGKTEITVAEAARFLGRDPRTLRGDRTFPAKPAGKRQRKVSLVNFARWRAV